MIAKFVIDSFLTKMRTEEGVGTQFASTYHEAREWLVSAFAAEEGSRWERHCLKKAFALILQANPYHSDMGLKPGSPAERAVRGSHYYYHSLSATVSKVEAVKLIQDGMKVHFSIPSEIVISD